MSVFSAKRDLEIILQFQELSKQLWAFEDDARKYIRDNSMGTLIFDREMQTRIHHALSNKEEYQLIRAKMSHIISDVERIATKRNIETTLITFPAPAVGGYVIPQKIYSSVLHDYSHCGIGRQLIIDTLNSTISACHKHYRNELINTFNPFHWLMIVFVFIIRIPFYIISLSGFNVEKIEDQMWAKIFKLLYILAIFYFLIELGISKEDILKNILSIK